MLTRKIDFAFNRQSTLAAVCKTERLFPYSGYSRKCFMCIEKSNTKKEKNNASSSKKDCQSCGKKVCHKHALRIYEYCNNS